MAIAAFGSIGLSLRSRGSVSITAEGVSRTVATRTRSLAWAEIEGLVAMPYGGVTLVAVPGKMDIVIPRFLDDYRACIAEIKNHSIQTLAQSSLRRKRKTSWMDAARIVLVSLAVSLALDSHGSHSVRIASFVVLLASIALFVRSDAQNRDRTVSRWISFTLFVGIALFILRRMSLNW